MKYNLKGNLASSKKFTSQYYRILSNDYPLFLNKYINTSTLKRLDSSSISCGCNYTNLFDLKFMYTNLDHSIAVALIIWNFTKDKKQTIAGLLHDIATPCFKHCIDFLNNDHESQESTEELTSKMIKESDELMRLLKEDNINIDEIDDYKKYPIADNKSPQLSADRLEYTLANGVFWHEVWNLEEIKVIYNDLIIVKNEFNVNELAFKSLDIAEKFIEKASLIWPTWIDNKDKITMQFIADIIKIMVEEKYISIADLYVEKEIDIINKILNCENKKISNSFLKFINTQKIIESEELINNKYCKTIKSKKRYINPLVLMDNKVVRISDVSNKIKTIIEEFKNVNFPKYVSFDFDLEK